jgi:hypothetical protein
MLTHPGVERPDVDQLSQQVGKPPALLGAVAVTRKSTEPFETRNKLTSINIAFAEHG